MAKRNNYKLTIEDYLKQNQIYPGLILDLQEAKYTPELVYVKTKYKYLKYKKK